MDHENLASKSVNYKNQNTADLVYKLIIIFSVGSLPAKSPLSQPVGFNG